MNIVLLPEAAKNHTQFSISEVATVQHIKQVLKRQQGDTLKIGCLNNKLGAATIKNITEDTVQLSEIVYSDLPPKKLNLTLILAIPRPKVLRRLIMDMTAIGIDHIVLINSYRSDKSYWQSPMLKRLNEFMIAGLQQGVDTVPPKISIKKRFKPFIEDELSTWTKHSQAVVAHPYCSQTLNNYIVNNNLPQIVCIGAEGGWIDYEINLFKTHNINPVGLGERILRTEAVVNAIAGRYL